MSRVNLFDKLINAYQNSHKASEFLKTMHLRNDQFQTIDGLRVQRMMKANDFITNKAGIVPVALQFIVKLLRYSPIMRPNVEQALRDKFFTEPLEIFKSPAQKILIPVEDVVPNENLPTFDGDIIQDLGSVLDLPFQPEGMTCKYFRQFIHCVTPWGYTHVYYNNFQKFDFNKIVMKVRKVMTEVENLMNIQSPNLPLQEQILQELQTRLTNELPANLRSQVS